MPFSTSLYPAPDVQTCVHWSIQSTTSEKKTAFSRFETILISLLHAHLSQSPNKLPFCINAEIVLLLISQQNPTRRLRQRMERHPPRLPRKLEQRNRSGVLRGTNQRVGFPRTRLAKPIAEPSIAVRRRRTGRRGHPRRRGRRTSQYKRRIRYQRRRAEPASGSSALKVVYLPGFLKPNVQC